MKGLRSLSVFAAASCLVFVVTTIEVAPLVGEGLRFDVIIGGQSAELDLPFLWVPITIFHVLIALRLYAHAWAVDEASLRPGWAADSASFVGCEWFLRGSWVALVSYLPTTLGKIAEGTWKLPGVSGEKYYVLVFGLVLIWDLMMYGRIANATSRLAFVQREGAEGAGALKFWWLGIDIALFLTALIVASAGFGWSGLMANWRHVIFIGFLGLSGGLCAFQLALWVPVIKKSIQTKSTMSPSPETGPIVS